MSVAPEATSDLPGFGTSTQSLAGGFSIISFVYAVKREFQTKEDGVLAYRMQEQECT